MTDKQEYDRYAKNLWVKVYQDVLSRNDDDFVYAKDIANQAVSQYMTMFGDDSVVKENFTTDSVSENKQTDTQTNLSSTDNTQFDWEDLLSVDEYVNLVKKHAYTIDVTKELNKLIYDKLKPLLSNVQNLHNSNFVEVPFKLDVYGDVMFRDFGNSTGILYLILSDLNIDQTRINRILLEMKSEDE